MNLFEKLMTIIQYVFLGFVQGFTEPIPVSSSGHLVMLQNIFGVKMEDLSFEILLHFASLIAIIIIYWDDIVRLASNGFKYLFKKEEAAKDDFNFILYLIVATIPAGVLGILFEDQIGQILVQQKWLEFH